jgi:hypothetical protein
MDPAVSKLLDSYYQIISVCLPAYLVGVNYYSFECNGISVCGLDINTELAQQAVQKWLYLLVLLLA